MANRITFKPILPKNPKFFESLEKDLLSAAAATMMGPIAKTLKGAEEDYINNWEHKPKITVQFVHQKTQLKLTVKPTGTHKRYWVMVSRGTKPHGISTDKESGLRVRSGYSPKTKANNVWGGSGTYSGPIYYGVASVDHPGITPRHFEENIVRTHSINTILMLRHAMEQVLRRHR